MQDISHNELREIDGGVAPVVLLAGIFVLGLSCGLKSTGN
jgi:lactobin A/cerein 7B family class IIb bacteriocin